MKKIACSAVGGGECTHVIEWEGDFDAFKEVAGAHAKEAHAEMIAAATPESMEQWEKDARAAVAEVADAA